MIEGGFGIRMNAPPPSRLRAALTATLALLLRDRNVKKTGTVLYCKPMNTETFSVRLDRSAKVRLQKLAKSTGRSRAFLAAEAISGYLDTNAVAGRHRYPRLRLHGQSSSSQNAHAKNL